MQARIKIKKVIDLIRKYIRVILFIINIVAMLLLYYATQAWWAVPSQSSIIPYLGLGFPIIMFFNVAFLIFWIVLHKWKFALLQIIVFALLWTPISTYYPFHGKTSDLPKDTFKVMSYNVRGFNWLTGEPARYNAMFKYILSQNADVICMQEFVVAEKKNKKGLISEEEFNEIMKDYPHKSIIKLGNLNSPYKYGIACYSKYPIKKSTRILFPESTYNGSAIHELEINGKSVTLINNHLESNRITAEDKQLYNEFFESKDTKMLDQVAHNIHGKMGTAFRYRETQAQMIKNYIKEADTDAIIVCGDFNDTPMSYTYNKIKGNLIDAYANSGFGPGVSYNQNMFWFRIDFIMHSDNIESYNTEIGNARSSDHYPIWTYLRFKD